MPEDQLRYHDDDSFDECRFNQLHEEHQVLAFVLCFGEQLVDLATVPSLESTQGLEVSQHTTHHSRDTRYCLEDECTLSILLAEEGVSKEPEELCLRLGEPLTHRGAYLSQYRRRCVPSCAGKEDSSLS